MNPMAVSPPHSPSYADYMAQAGYQFHVEPFWYAVDPTVGGTVPLGAAATTTSPIQITQEADFIAEKITGFVAPVGGTFTLLITDNATSRQLSNQAIVSTAIIGTAERPAIMKPRLFRRNSAVQFTFTNISGAAITRLQVVLVGYKIYDRNALNLNRPVR